MDKIKHCIKCNGFTWWDGDFCCSMQMKVIEHSPDGKFYIPISKLFDANTCKYYYENSGYSNISGDYFDQYIDFLEEYYELPNIENKELILKELGYTK